MKLPGRRNVHASPDAFSFSSDAWCHCAKVVMVGVSADHAQLHDMPDALGHRCIDHVALERHHIAARCDHDLINAAHRDAQ